MDALARLTPAFDTDCYGRVHSVFDHAVNLALGTAQGERLLTLLPLSCPAVPDSVCLPEAALRGLSVGDPVQWRDGCLWLGGRRFPTARDAPWDGHAPRLREATCADAFLRLTAALDSGFDLLPERTRQKADAALAAGDWQLYLGLGYGLTPSYDDACVGMMALYRALGRAVPRLSDLSVTTDVSARYLRLGQEGYFSQPLIEVIRSLGGGGDMKQAIARLSAFGATSGRDTLYGVRVGLLS